VRLSHSVDRPSGRASELGRRTVDERGPAAGGAGVPLTGAYAWPRFHEQLWDERPRAAGDAHAVERARRLAQPSRRPTQLSERPAPPRRPTDPSRGGYDTDERRACNERYACTTARLLFDLSRAHTYTCYPYFPHTSHTSQFRSNSCYKPLQWLAVHMQRYIEKMIATSFFQDLGREEARAEANL
jgi:hypothetical protein